MKICRYLWLYWFDYNCPILSASFTFSSSYAVVQIRISNKVDFIYTFWNRVSQCQDKLFKSVSFPMQNCLFAIILRIKLSVCYDMFETMVSETSNSFTSLLFAVDHLLPSGKAIPSGSEHRDYLIASLKSTAFPNFNDQNMILAMILWFTSKMNVSLPVFIFTVFPVIVNCFRLFLLLVYKII